MVLVFFTAAWLPVKAQAPTITRPSIPSDVKGMITYYAEQYGAPENELLTVAKCESGFNPKAVGDKGSARNVFQFHKDTFLTYASWMGETLNYDSAHDQIKLASWIFIHHPKERRAWTCFTKFFTV